MNLQTLISTTESLLPEGKGLLAIDESTPTCGKRFAAYGIGNTEANRRDYRAMLLTTAGLSESISGAILYDESLRMRDAEGTCFPDLMRARGIIPGIKVDTGAKDLAGHPGEKVTEGLDDLRDRLAEYSGLGARFAKWRAVITIGNGLPSRGCLEANAAALARYAALCQEAGLVPIVEPEVMLEGSHDIRRCRAVSMNTLTVLFTQLRIQRVALEGMILKASMVLPGKDCLEQANDDEIARATLDCLYQCVPAAVPGVAFLSGGQSCRDATVRLNQINVMDGGRAPWRLTFSYARALQEPALRAWAGDNANIERAQAALAQRARCNRDAAGGRYQPDQEREAA